MGWLPSAGRPPRRNRRRSLLLLPPSRQTEQFVQHPRPAGRYPNYPGHADREPPDTSCVSTRGLQGIIDSDVQADAAGLRGDWRHLPGVASHYGHGVRGRAPMVSVIVEPKLAQRGYSPMTRPTLLQVRSAAEAKVTAKPAARTVAPARLGSAPITMGTTPPGGSGASPTASKAYWLTKLQLSSAQPFSPQLVPHWFSIQSPLASYLLAKTT